MKSHRSKGPAFAHDRQGRANQMAAAARRRIEQRQARLAKIHAARVARAAVRDEAGERAKEEARDPRATAQHKFDCVSTGMKPSPPKPPKPPKPPRGKSKPERTIKLANGSALRIGGCESPDGVRYVRFHDGRSHALTPYDAWHGGGGDGVRELKVRGITIVSGMSQVREAGGELKHFPVIPIADRPGWSGAIFALPDGRVIAPPNVGRYHTAFVGQPNIVARGGTLEGWRREVAEPLAEHMLASFCVMAMFAGPLLRMTARPDNFGFELAGRAGAGKSTLQFVIATAAGPGMGIEGSTYWRTCNSTINALESTLPTFNDMTMVLEEAALIPGGGNKDDRANQMRGLAFRLSTGRIKDRYGERRGSGSRLVYVISTNEPIGTLTSRGHFAEAQAIADRLMTLPISEDRLFGVFDSRPPRYGSTGEFAESLMRSAAEHYGHALPTFLKYLVERRARTPKKLAELINARMARFVKASRADTDNGSDMRVAGAFGLVYVAGSLAKRARVLPSDYKPLRAALTSYRLHRDYGRAALSFDDRLRAIARHPSVIDLGQVDAATVTKLDRESCRAYLFTNRSGERELLVPSKMRSSVLPDWNRIRNDPDVRRRLKRSEQDRNTNDRPIPGPKQPVYCFDVSDLWR